MLAFTLPTAQMCARFGPVPEGTALIPWAVDAASPHAKQINAVLLPNRFDINAGFPLLAALPNLQFLQLPAAGHEQILPLLPQLRSDVVVSNGRGIHDAETSEMAIGLLLASMRGIDVAVRNMKKQDWHPQFQPSLSGRSVLLIGYGAIGRAIATRLAPFGVHLTIVARTARSENETTIHSIGDLPQLLPSAEVVILATPLTEQTHNLVDAKFIDSLPIGARIINVARGAIVNTDALLAALTARRIYAAIDVADPEPLPIGHALWNAPHLILTPHIAGHTTATESRTLDLVRAQMNALLAGSPPKNIVAVD